MRLKDVNISDYKGNTLTVYALLVNIELKESKSCKYGVFYLRDQKVLISARMWNYTDIIHETGCIYKVSLSVRLYLNQISFVIESLECVNESRDSYIFPDTLEADMKEFKSYLNLLNNKLLRSDLVKIFNLVWKEFKTSAGAVSVHHNYIGGLLEHTNEVARYVVAVTDYFPDVNKDLALASALVHDIGKIYEYDTNILTGEIKIAGKGILYGHIVMGYKILDEALTSTTSIEKEVILNAVLSHHGELENGSPTTPATLEAYLVHQADIFSCNRYLRKVHENSLEIGEVNRSFLFGKSYSFFKAKDVGSTQEVSTVI